MKILMTGNPAEGLAKSFSALKPETVFLSRRSGLCLDLTKFENQIALAELSLSFDVFVNSSYISHFIQMEICRKVWTLWKDKKKRGTIINIGSSARDLIRPDNRFYPTSKRALEDYSRQLHLYSNWGNSKIRVGCINFGGIATDATLGKWPHFSHLSPEFCAETLLWALHLPQNCNLDLLQITPIQPAARGELRKNTTLSSSPSDYLISDFDDE